MARANLKLLATAFQIDQFPPAQDAEIVFSGRSNVGKSSLLNRLGGGVNRATRKEGARVSQHPGCTQSINFYRIWPGVRLVDLPGFGFARLPAAHREKIRVLIETYLAQRKTVAAIVHLADARHGLQTLDWQMIEWGQHFNTPYLLTLNKCDKLSRSSRGKRLHETKKLFQDKGFQPEILMVSAETGEGVPELKKRLREASTVFLRNRVAAAAD